jgi:hypothetical protein
MDIVGADKTPAMMVGKSCMSAQIQSDQSAQMLDALQVLQSAPEHLAMLTKLCFRMSRLCQLTCVRVRKC